MVQSNQLQQQINHLKAVYQHFYKIDLSDEKEDLFSIAEIRPIEDLQFVEFFFDWWVPLQDEALDEIEPFSEPYADLLARRGFTLDEFKWVLSGRIDEEQYKDERVFQYLYINDKQEHNYFISTHSKSNDEEDLLETFHNAIKEQIASEHTLLYEFFFNSKVGTYISRRRLRRHLYIPAGSGSGKSEVIKFIFHNLQKDKKLNLNLIEPHMDLSLEIMQFALNKKNPERVIYLDPFIRRTAKFLLGEDIIKDDYTFVINPFDLEGDEATINAMVQELSSVFFTLLKSEATEQMEVIIEACIETLLRANVHRETPYNISDLKRFMSVEENTDLVRQGLKLKNIERKKIIEQLADERNFKSTRSGVYLRIAKLIGDEEFRKLLVGKSTVDIGKAMNSGKVIICNFSEALMGAQSSSAMGKFFISLLQGHAIKRAMIPKKFRPTSFAFVDECHEFLTPTLKPILTGARKYNLFMILANQFIGQGMDTQMKRTILANTGLKIAGNMDSTSLEAISKEMGNIKPKDFERLDPYQFFLYDNKFREMGTKKIKAPDYLVKKKPPFYMKKKHLRDFFLYMVHESGFYVKMDSEQKQTRNGGVSGTPGSTTPGKNIYDPNFED
ncbi:hypothetical protein ES702_03392 [subsurface metagenome]